MTTDTDESLTRDPSIAPPEPAKNGRGPTRRGVIAQDLCEDVEALDPEERRIFLSNLGSGVEPAALRTIAKDRRRDLKKHIADEEAHVAKLEVCAHLLSRAASLTEAQRRLLRLTFAEEPAS